MTSETPWIGPNGQVMERLELHLTYTCPERCVFCSEDHRMRQYNPFPVNWARAATVLRSTRIWRWYMSTFLRSQNGAGSKPVFFRAVSSKCSRSAGR